MENILLKKAEFAEELGYRDHAFYLREAANLIFRLKSTLSTCECYFEARADADCDHVGFIPNEEMKILSEIREIIK